MIRFLLLSDPRTGSTLLANLLNSHPDIHVINELLNDENQTPDGMDTLDYLRTEIFNKNAHCQKKCVGLKVFPEQIFQRKISFEALVTNLGITHVIVLWRKQFLEALASKLIATKTGIWFSAEEDKECHQITLGTLEIKAEFAQTTQNWRKIGEEWPIHVQPIFVTYENLIADQIEVCNRILYRLSCEQLGSSLRAYGKRQNPCHLSEKIINWVEIPAQLQTLELDVYEILKPRIDAKLKVPRGILPLVPDREPPPPPDGWRYRVAMPYMSTQLKEYVYDAVEFGAVSSATSWPTKMSEKLKKIFNVPVAMPCSSGFTALVLALQAAHIGKGDEVILPSLTMVAVPNSVSFLGATPVFADSSPTNYNPGWVEIEKVVSPRTKAIILTHTYGVPVPMEDLSRIQIECKRNGWILIEDISECVGIKVIDSNSREKYLGTFGDYACASLYANKIVHAGDGGFVLAKDPGVAARLQSLANHGFTPSFHFIHFEIAINGKINGIGAAMACGCLEDLPIIMEHRAMLAATYRELLADIFELKVMPSCGVGDTPWVFGVECKDKLERTKLRAFMAKHRIETRDYFFPLHLQPAYNNLQQNVRLPHAEKLATTGFYLPTYTALQREDLEFIVSVIRAFFYPSGEDSRVLSPPPAIPPKQRVVIKPGTFEVVMKGETSSDLLSTRGHLLSRIVSIGIQLQECLVQEKWGLQQVLMKDCRSCLEQMPDLQSKYQLEEYWSPFLEYFKSQDGFENPIQKPWLLEDLGAKEYAHAHCIPTTTDPETLQLLIWLMKTRKPSTVWEIGCWLGHASVRMSAAAKTVGLTSRILACDAFKWQTWMNNFISGQDHSLKAGKSFLSRFKRGTRYYSDAVTAVEWPYEINVLPEELRSNPKPDLVFLDMSQDDSELELIWTLTSPYFKPGSTMVVFNGINRCSLPFLTRHGRELRAFAKPVTIAKAFVYIGTRESEPLPVLTTSTNLKLRFHNSPSWDHHHKNAFQESMDILRKEFHDDDATTLFIPAIEETLCDNPELLISNPWIGIIHSVVEHKEQFYTPDLKRLCSPSYSKAMEFCKGLFTLTSFQAEYLRSNLRGVIFPIQPLVYPILHSNIDATNSNVPLMWEQGQPIDLTLIGSFARDWDLFFKCNIPSNLQKVLVTGDYIGELAAVDAPEDVRIVSRLSEEDYEDMLKRSIVFLPLKYEGAANTIVLECIDRNTPIVLPRMTSCTEYIGEDYPLLYDHDGRADPNLMELITKEKVEFAVKYLENMDKTKFQPQQLVEAVKGSSVLLASQGGATSEKYDVTISICSYKRTHHLPKILSALWNDQNFIGRIQIILWNNNEARSDVVQKICAGYLQKSTANRSLKIINSTENYYCAVRLALAPLMKSDALLICDDDVIPGPSFVSFFMNAHAKNPRDILCLRGHVFLPHELDLGNPTNAWGNYEDLRFKSDEAPEQFIHFVHADACLIPRAALRECASVEMPDPSFNLVDDYWISYLLSHSFNRQLRKLSTAGLRDSQQPLQRTEDSDTPGLALHTRPEVKDARIRLYIHHMLQGWPSWPTPIASTISSEKILSLKQYKKMFWNVPFIGFNISSHIKEAEIQALVDLKVTVVRIGAVGVGGIGSNYEHEFKGFTLDPKVQLKHLKQTLSSLEKCGISAVITLHNNIAAPLLWKFIANGLVDQRNVVGYDIINEPSTESEQNMHYTELAKIQPNGLPSELKIYLEMIKCIREVDPCTPLIIEPSFWAHIDALRILPRSLFAEDSNLLASFHFYEPRKFTHRSYNKNGKFTFPGEVPIYNGPWSEMAVWNKDRIKEKFTNAKVWADSVGVRLHVGEFGVCREIDTGLDYLKAVLEACAELKMSGFLFCMGDVYWDAMNYELGRNPYNFENLPIENNVYLSLLMEYVVKIKAKERDPAIIAA